MSRTSQALVLLMLTAASGAAIAQRPPASPPAAPATPPASAATAAADWPTYNRDHGGTRFSPLTDITPANVATLDVAWTYHMKPAVAATPATPDATLPAGHEAPPTPGAGAAPPPVPPPGQSAATSSNQTRGRRGYASSASTPLVVDGTLYMTTPYARVVALDAATGTEKWAYRLPSGNPSTRGLEYWPGDATTPAQIVFGTSDAKLYS